MNFLKGMGGGMGGSKGMGGASQSMSTGGKSNYFSSLNLKYILLEIVMHQREEKKVGDQGIEKWDRQKILFHRSLPSALIPLVSVYSRLNHSPVIFKP
jgi:hypothetical protein